LVLPQKQSVKQDAWWVLQLWHYQELGIVRHLRLLISGSRQTEDMSVVMLMFGLQLTKLDLLTREEFPMQILSSILMQEQSLFLMFIMEGIGSWLIHTLVIAFMLTILDIPPHHIHCLKSLMATLGSIRSISCRDCSNGFLTLIVEEFNSWMRIIILTKRAL